MDSMRNLHTSLPRTSSSNSRTRRPARSQPLPPAELLTAFKSAALSITQLYKSAAADQDASRAAGYQDALDDLLEFLDHENLGLGDGEGWQVRQWATERLTPSAAGYEAGVEMETEGEKQSSTARKDTGTQAESDVPADHGKEQEAEADEDSQQQMDTNNSSSETEQPPVEKQPSEVFHFRAGQQLPRSPQLPDAEADQTNENTSPNPSIHLQVLPRSSRRTGSSRDRISHAGTKRNFADFFDLGSLGGGFGGFKDSINPGLGIGKRGRFT